MTTTPPKIIFFDDHTWFHLLPLTYTKSIADLRIGLWTIREKWLHVLKQDHSGTLSVNHLSKRYRWEMGKDNLFINSSILPNQELVKQVIHLQPKEVLVDGDLVIAVRHDDKHPPLIHKASGEWLPLVDGYTKISCGCSYLRINYPWDLYLLNKAAIEQDFEWLTAGRNSAPIDPSNGVVNPERIFIEESAEVRFSLLDASAGPIYIGNHAKVLGGDMIKGGFMMGDHAVLKMGAKIYGATTFGPYSKIGGEVNNSVIMGYSNKSHDGYLGNAVIGEWCNLGADTNCSNLKNNYSKVKVWSYVFNKMMSSDQLFCGLIMGDHSKCGINTMFNTGTVVGVAANIFGAGFPPKFIPSFSWGGASGFETYRFDKAVETATAVYTRRNKEFSEIDKGILKAIFQRTERYRKSIGTSEK